MHVCGGVCTYLRVRTCECAHVRAHLSLHSRVTESVGPSPRLACVPGSGGPSISATRHPGDPPPRTHAPTHLPERVLLLGEDLEVLLCQLHGGQRLQPQVGPGVQEAHQVLEGVQAQAVVPIVGQVRHEDADLLRGGGAGLVSI